jgi:hypothetical protein
LAKVKIWSDRDEAFGRELIRDASDLIVEAERFHHDDQRGIRTSGRGTRQMRRHLLGAGTNRYFIRDDFHD